ncbi:uncharacterized protein DUF1838 [Maribacter vaceletii]|uniref:Uncharacterized protein DUF1838 n=1 Tax=Maribacter vaceletii TaxID=1206816 RepID=A0A495EED6_9FLAO|nr:DUF1838 family protein [Maribacter vaceletii]RKR15254.1 uncharacterized protein DUF1838 [Maribacter vaceletii]
MNFYKIKHISKIVYGLFTLLLVFNCSPKESAKKEIKENNIDIKKIDYDLNDPKDQLLIFEKIQGDISGKITYSYSEGRVFGIRPDKPDSLNVFGKEVFRYSGCGIKIMRLLENGNIETKSKGWLLYRDPKTNAFLSNMVNPYTGKEVEVPPFRAGIRGGEMTPLGPVVDANFNMESTAFNAPLNLVFTEMGDKIHITRHAFTKWFEKKSQTWRTEMTLDTYDVDRKYLTDRSYTHIPSEFHWTSETSWLSILKMQGTPGHMIWTSSGSTFFNKEDLPKDFIAATEEKQPGIFTEELKWDEK